MAEKLAIIGSGISGMACAHFLHEDFDVTLFEKNNYVGGHSNTISAKEGSKEVPVDTGFMVFSRINYPNLIKLFDELNVPMMNTDMSFSVQHLPSRLEYNGSGLNGLFAQRKNIFSPRHIKMLLQIDRFNQQSVEDMKNERYKNYSVKEYVQEKGFGDDMMFKYLLPMSSALWSTPTDTTMMFPAVALIRFFNNHGFLGLNTQHQWLTIKGGSREYVKRLTASFSNHIRIQEAAEQVEVSDTSVSVKTAKGLHHFDKVIFACHADEALALIHNPTSTQQDLLSKFKYQPNKAILHTDTKVMPKNKSVWSSWNYRIEEKNGQLQPSTIYYMNNLQKVSDKEHYFVSINDPGNINDGLIIKEIDYDHPIFTVDAMTAQLSLPKLNESGPLYFCGSYFRYGFHEDAFTSSLDLCKRLLGSNHPKVAKYTDPLYDEKVASIW